MQLLLFAIAKEEAGQILLPTQEEEGEEAPGHLSRARILSLTAAGTVAKILNAAADNAPSSVPPHLC